MKDFINESKYDQIYKTQGHELRIHRYAEAIECKINGNCVIGKYSSARKSIFGGFNSIGCHSYVTSCEIGRYSTIGSRVSIGAFEHPTNWLSVSEFQYRDTLFCYGQQTFNFMDLDKNLTITSIGHDVWVGDNVFIKSGVIIGNGSIIGASSVVTKSVPPYSIVIGNPAKELRKRFSEELIHRLQKSEWWELSISEIDSLNLNYKNIHETLKKINQFKSGKD